MRKKSKPKKILVAGEIKSRAPGTPFSWMLPTAPYKKCVLAELTTAVCAEYADDDTKPSVILSLIEDGFYASIRRYPRSRDSFVVCSTRGHDSPEEALRALAKEWLGSTAAKDALRAALS